jgi:hypothetical protein
MAYQSFLPEEREHLAQVLAQIADEACKPPDAAEHIAYTKATQHIIVDSLRATVELALECAVEHANKVGKQCLKLLRAEYDAKIRQLEGRIAELESK